MMWVYWDDSDCLLFFSVFFLLNIYKNRMSHLQSFSITSYISFVDVCMCKQM